MFAAFALFAAVAAADECGVEAGYVYDSTWNETALRVCPSQAAAAGRAVIHAHCFFAGLQCLFHFPRLKLITPPPPKKKKEKKTHVVGFAPFNAHRTGACAWLALEAPART